MADENVNYALELLRSDATFASLLVVGLTGMGAAVFADSTAPIWVAGLLWAAGVGVAAINASAIPQLRVYLNLAHRHRKRREFVDRATTWGFRTLKHDESVELLLVCRRDDIWELFNLVWEVSRTDTRGDAREKAERLADALTRSYSLWIRALEGLKSGRRTELASQIDDIQRSMRGGAINREDAVRMTGSIQKRIDDLNELPKLEQLHFTEMKLYGEEIKRIHARVMLGDYDMGEFEADADLLTASEDLRSPEEILDQELAEMRRKSQRRLTQ